MLKIRTLVLALGILISPLASADTRVSIGIGLPHVSIGIHVPAYPQLVVVPGYPVYYAPRMHANYFFYDGLYWVFHGDNWYASSWYNGPWWFVEPYGVPVHILRVPVRYYRSPPSYFRAWRPDTPPRWGNHWGPEWEQHRSGWDRWDRRDGPAPAPLPAYQRQYSGDRYPRHVEQQRELQHERYRYQPRDPVVRKQYQERYEERSEQRATDRQNRQGGPEERGSRQQQDIRGPVPRQQEGPSAPRSQSPQRGDGNTQWPGPGSPGAGSPSARESRHPSQPWAEPRRQQPWESQGRDERQRNEDAGREHKRNQEKDWDRRRNN